MNQHFVQSRSLTEDIPDNIADLDGEGLAVHLENRVLQTLGEVEGSAYWRMLVDPSTDIRLAREILSEVYLEIGMYQPDAIEAAIAAIAQMPRSMPVGWFDEMLHHQVEEFDHGEMAIRDFIGIGGSEAYARKRRQSPSSFAVAAVWRNIVHMRDPFLYLGAVYLFDGLTPIVTDRVMRLLAGRAELKPGMEYIAHHATADIAHTASVRALIVNVADRYPEAKASIAYGYEYFAQVYPMPCWDAAARRAVNLHSHR